MRMERISLKGVAIGNIADIVSSNVIGLLLAVYILTSAAPSELADGSATKVLMASSFYWVSVVIFGALCSLLGGYVSARIAKHDDVLNGALSSVLCVAFGVYALLSGSAAGHVGLHLALLPASVALGALGGYLSSQRRAEHQ
jgi:hypothetical protein